MTPDVQTVIAVVIVLACAAYVGRMMWRTFSSTSAGCGGDCSCDATEKQVKHQ